MYARRWSSVHTALRIPITIPLGRYMAFVDVDGMISMRLRVEGRWCFANSSQALMHPVTAVIRCALAAHTFIHSFLSLAT